MRTRLLAASIALMLIAVTNLALNHNGTRIHEQAVATRGVIAEATTTSSPSTSSTTTTAAPAVPLVTAAPVTATPVTATPTTARRTVTSPPTPATAPPPTVVNAAPLRTGAPLAPGDPNQFRGLGAWIDVYDWSNEFTGSKPSVGPNDVDRMANLGVQALYVQGSKQSSPNDVVDPDLLRPIIQRAHQRGMRVVVWYAPSLTDPALDLRKLRAIAALNVEAVGVDIESRNVTDVAERNRRLVDLSIALRQHLPAVAIAAIVMPAVLMEVVNPNFWPNFPYRDLDPAYDAWMPMDYWTSRKADSGYRDAYRYTAENIDRLRAQLGRSDVPVHAIGGIADATTADDVDAFYRAATERHALGGSIYDYRTTADALWSRLAPFRG